MSAGESPRRLCSEIQLFDLCMKSKCDKKDGRFCTDKDVLARFEAISQEDDFPPDQYVSEDVDEEGEDEDFFSGCDADFDDEDDYYGEES